MFIPGGPSRSVIDPGMMYPSTPFRICNSIEFFLFRSVLRGPTKNPTSLSPNVSYPSLQTSNFLVQFMLENRTTCKIFKRKIRAVRDLFLKRVFCYLKKRIFLKMVKTFVYFLKYCEQILNDQKLINKSTLLHRELRFGRVCQLI